MSAVDLSSDAALVAIFLLTSNILLGLLISMRYSPLRNWPHRHINIFKWHNWTGYTALSVAGLHPFILLFSRTAGFKVRDVVLPIWSPSQPLENTLGAVALYCVILVAVTSYYRLALGRRTWKRLHFTTYVDAAFFFTHGLLTDPHLKNRPFDPLDAEKVFVELCLLVVVFTVGLRLRYGMRKRRLVKTQRSLA
jgi:predicted ferric reductase